VSVCVCGVSFNGSRSSPAGVVSMNKALRKLALALVASTISVVFFASMPSASAQEALGTPTITNATWGADGTLTFSWTDPPLPSNYPGSYWSGGTWWVDAPDGNQECTDYLPSDGSTNATESCTAMGDSPDGEYYLTISVQCTCVVDSIGDEMNEYAQSEPYSLQAASPPVTAPPVTAPPVTAPPVTAPPVTAPPVTAPPVTAPPSPSPGSPSGPLPAVSQEDCLHNNPFLIGYNALQAELERAKTKLAQLQDSLHDADVNPPGGRTSARAHELIHFTIPEQQGNIGRIEDGLRRMAPNVAQVEANCAGNQAQGGNLPQQMNPGNGVRVAAQPGARGFQALPWLVDIQSGALYWTENLTHFSCRFGSTPDPDKASFIIQRCRYVITPDADAVLEGTQFSVIVAPGKTVFDVFQGAVEVSDLTGTKIVTVTAGQTTTVPASGAPTDPISFDPALVDHWWNGSPFVGTWLFYMLLGGIGGAVIAAAMQMSPNRRRHRANLHLAMASAVSGLSEPSSPVDVVHESPVGIMRPGWYADPSGSGGIRWWDGQRWASETQPDSVEQGPPRVG